MTYEKKLGPVFPGDLCDSHLSEEQAPDYRSINNNQTASSQA